MQTGLVFVGAGFFELYGLTPLAGRLDMPGAGAVEGARVINETAMRQFGYASPEAATGQIVRGRGEDFLVLGVVRDFSLGSVDMPIIPTLYNWGESSAFGLSIHVKLAGQEIPETLAAIDRIWTATGNVEPINRYFLDDYIQTLYLSVLRQGQGFAVFAGLAVLLACLGLIGLSVSTAERRRKEIGIRKSMGASSRDVLRLLSWEFAKPVLLANIIAWPVAYWAMRRWLNGFAYRIDLEFWMFAAAGALALLIALATVSIHSWLVARAKPVTALRCQ
jgi:putative ABC transport system permease protein